MPGDLGPSLALLTLNTHFPVYHPCELGTSYPFHRWVCNSPPHPELNTTDTMLEAPF